MYLRFFLPRGISPVYLRQEEKGVIVWQMCPPMEPEEGVDRVLGIGGPDGYSGNYPKQVI
jgi:hypothetical protein